MSGRPVPWPCWEEWKRLRDELLHTSPARQELGLQHVAAWRLRGKLPLGVDATAYLLDARRADEEWQGAVAWAAESAAAKTARDAGAGDARRAAAAAAAVAAGELPLRLRYSLPLIRLVNGISDSQQRGRVASSVAVLSDAAGLPRALVDVRHEATHSELPSLPLLRAAADSALAWLRENYWDGQSRALAAAAERITALLTTLAESWRAAMAAGMSGGASGGGLIPDGEDEEEDAAGEGAEGGSSASYSGVEGKKLRRQAMSELRSLVPPAFTHELLQPVLDCPVLLPPDWPGPPRPTAAQLPVAQAPAAAAAEGGPQRPQVAEKAWQSAMKHLLRWYPRLRVMLLKAAVKGLVDTVPGRQGVAGAAEPAAKASEPAAEASDATRQTGNGSAELRAQNYARWALRLLPAGAATAVAAASGGALAQPQVPKLGSPGRRQPSGQPQQASSKFAKKAAAAAAAAPPQGGAADESGGEEGEASLSGPLTPAQLQELLRTALTGLGRAPPPAELPGSTGSGSGSADWLLEAAAAAAATGVEEVPVDASAQDPGTSGDQPRLSSCYERVEACDAGQGDSTAGNTSAVSAGPRDASLKEIVAALHRALLLALRPPDRGKKRPRARNGQSNQAGEQPMDDAVGGTAGSSEALGSCLLDSQLRREQVAGRPEDAGRAEQESLQELPPTGRLRKWQRCLTWSRCAIGCLPCPLNPNGRIPPLDLPKPSLEPPEVMPACTQAEDGAVRGRGSEGRESGPDGGDGAAGVAGALQAGKPGDRGRVFEEIDYYIEPDDQEEGGGVAADAQRDGDLAKEDAEYNAMVGELESEGGASQDTGGGGGGGAGLFGALLGGSAGANAQGVGAISFLL